MDERMVDGNALDGPLASVFGFDVTTARATCDHCGMERVVAALSVYLDAPGGGGSVPGLRSRAVAMRMDRRAGLHLDLRGTRVLTADVRDGG